MSRRALPEHILRPALPENFHPATSDLIFQVVDWKSCDITDDNEEAVEEDDDGSDEDEPKKVFKPKNLMIRGYGVTEEGNSICVHISGFQPYFYFKIPQEWTQTEFNMFRDSVKMLVPDFHRNGLINTSIVQKKEFYGFTNNQLFQFGVFVFRNNSSYNAYINVLKEKTIYVKRLGQEFDMRNKIYETKVTPLLRFFHAQDLDPAGWCRIPAGTYKLNTRREEKMTRCQLDISLPCFRDIEKYDKNTIGKLLVASYDIECTSQDGSFPSANRAFDQVIQIGVTVNRFGDKGVQYKYIATLKDCLPIDGVEVESYQTERDLILGWANFMARLDPDIITGYNIWGFDWEYLYKRAENAFDWNGNKTQSYHKILYRALQRIRSSYRGKNIDEDPTVKLTEKKLASSAMGENFLKYIDIEGVVQIDLLKYFQREEKLDSYKLDHVAKEFMKMSKVDLKPNQIFQNYQEGTPDKIQEIAVYCIMDCELVNELINKKKVITNNIGMANVCVVPFSYIFLRGQGIKIFSLVAKFCREENFLIKDLTEEDKDNSSYEGAIVFTPRADIYFEPVVVMDYNSLYPSSMIAENISHDSILGSKEYRLKPNASGQNKEEDYELIKDSIRYEYDGLEGYHYIDIEYDTFEGKDDEKKKVGYKMCRYAERDDGSKSVLPRILVKLLKARKDTRKKAEYVTHYMKDGSIEYGIPEEKEDGMLELFNVEKGKIHISKDDVERTEETYNDFEKNVFNSLQLAYKVTCNSLYGQVGATTSPICYKELAACTTATGRRMVVMARDLTLQKFEKSKLVYGDSVTAETPILLRRDGEIYVKNIGDLNHEWMEYKEFMPEDTNRTEKQQTSYDAEIWTAHGWANINRVIRHKTNKKIYRVMTHTGCVDVTEDHSLLDESLHQIKPKDVRVGMKLRHGTPFEYHSKNYGYYDEIYVKQFDLRETSMLDIQKEFMELRREKMYVLLRNTDDIHVIEMIYSNYYLYENKNITEIISIEILRDCGEDEFVYDIETTDGTFQAGIGEMIVKNTDSVFINFTDHIKMNHPDRELTEKEILIESIQMGIKAAKNINANVKKPQNIEYEKTLWPFIIFSKKRYFGNLYEHNPEEYHPKYMGIVLKRRDNAPIVKTIYGGVLDIILNKRDIEGSKQFFRNSIQDLLEGKVHISQLVISKTLKSTDSYSNPNQIAHKVLADRMGDRDPGNKPQSNDRIPYCYIDASNLKCAVCKGKVNPEKCKCITCMNIYCSTHLVRHKNVCTKICRFCKLTETQTQLQKCDICTGHYCRKCYEKHRSKKENDIVVHTNKCKKPLTCKILQGDILEHPAYIEEEKLKIDYTYYLEHQIQEPVYQIFKLIQDNPAKIIEDIVRKNENAKKGNHAITDWISKMRKQTPAKVVEEHPAVEEITEEMSVLPEKPKKIIMQIEQTEITTFDVTKQIDYNAMDDDTNLLGEMFEPDRELTDGMEEEVVTE